MMYLRKYLNTIKKLQMNKIFTRSFDKEGNSQSETEIINDVDADIITKEHAT